MFDPVKLFTWAGNNINLLCWYNSDGDKIPTDYLLDYEDDGENIDAFIQATLESYK